MYLILSFLIGLPLLTACAGLLFLRWRSRGETPLSQPWASAKIQPATPLFELEDVQKSYPDKDGGEVVAFSVTGPSLVIEEGLTVILAPSGRGKSTLLGLLGGMDTPTHGRVYFEGKPLPTVEGLDLQRHRAHNISFVFQSLNLVTHLSALDNVALPLIAAGVERARALARAEAYLDEVGLTGQEMRRRPGALSGGQQQRVAVARAAASNAKVILADEPTGALDVQNARHVMEVFRNLARREGKSVVLVTHNIELAEAFADRIIYLEEDGRFSVAEVQNKRKQRAIEREASALSDKPGLGWWNSLRYAWSDLRFRLTITAITVATVAFSVYYLFAVGMLCIRFYDTRDQTLRQAQLEKVDAFPEDGNALNLRITDARLAEMRAWPEVRVAFPSVERLANFSIAADKQQLLVLSSTVPGDPQSSEGLLWGAGIDEGKEQAVISRAVLTRLGGKLTADGPEPRVLTLELQRKFKGKDQLERRSLPIVGVTRHDSRERVFVPLALARTVNDWSKGAIADLDGRDHKEEENLTFPRAIAYGPADEEARALKELGEQKLLVKKLGGVSTIHFNGTAWTHVDGAVKAAIDKLPKQPGIVVQPAYSIKLAGQTWFAWDKDDPRWQQITADARNDLGWVGTEAPAAVPTFAQRQPIPAGLIPAGGRLISTQTLRWLLFDLQRADLARGELIRTPDCLEAIRQETKSPGSVLTDQAIMSVLLRPTTSKIRAALDEAKKLNGRDKLVVEELPAAPINVELHYAKRPAKKSKLTVLRVPGALLRLVAEAKEDAKPLAVLVTADPKTAPDAIELGSEKVMLDAVIAGPNDLLLLDRTYTIEPTELRLTRLWVHGPWQAVSRLLADAGSAFQVEKSLTKPPTFALLTPARDIVLTRSVHSERKAAAAPYLLADLRVEKNRRIVKLIAHSASAQRIHLDHDELLCSEEMARARRCELRSENSGLRTLRSWPAGELPPDVAVVHDDLFRQLAFLACDAQVMPDRVERITALGVTQPVLLPAFEELARQHKQPLTWLTPIQRQVKNKYEVKEKGQAMKRETIHWLASMKPAVDFAESLPSLNVRVRGDIWAAVGTEPRSPRAFETRLREGQWLDGKDTLQIVLPADLAEKQGIGVGEAVTVQVLRNEEKAEHPISLRLKVVGLSSDETPLVSARLCRDVALWRSRVFEFNEAKHRFESPIEANKELGDHRVVLFARSEGHVKPLVQKLRERGYQTEDRLQEMEGMRHLSVVLTAFASFFVFGFVVMSLITVMVTTLMHVQSKQWEIGILRSIGLSWTNVLRLFVLQGAFIGTISFLLAALSFAATGNWLRGLVADLFSIKDPVFTEGGPFTGGQGAMLYLVVLAAILTLAQSCGGVLAGCWHACRRKPNDALRHRE